MHRFAFVIPMLAACAAGGSKMSMAAPQAPAAAPASGGGAVVASGPASTMTIPEQLVIEGSISLEVDEINDLVPALHGLVDGMGGRVVNEVVTGAETSWSATVKLRVPPNRVEEVVAFLAKRGTITDRRINATDVSKQLFDQDLAIKNLRTTLDRLTALMGSQGLNVQQILEIEKEMTRIRGQIDQLEGDQRFLQDRVGLATLDVTMMRSAGATVTVAKAKAYPGARGAMLTLFDPGTRKRNRMGAGFVLHTVFRQASLEVDVFQKEANADGSEKHAAAIATFGGAMYSDFLGHGERQFLNPFLGFRMGYGYLDGHRFVVQAEAGVELFKSKYITLDASVRGSGLIGSSSDLGFVTGVGAVVAF